MKENPVSSPVIKRRRKKGQNLIELALTLPLVLVMLLFILELGRAWFAYEGAKLAAMEGAHAAAIHHNASVGQNYMIQKLAAADLEAKSPDLVTVTQVPNKHAYQANVTVTFSPFFGGVSIPTLSGPIELLPAEFDISYTAVEDVAVY